MQYAIFNLQDGATASSLTIDESTCSDNCETLPEIVYAFSTEPTTSFITMVERTINWSNAAIGNVGNYTVTVVATVDTVETACSQTATF